MRMLMGGTSSKHRDDTQTLILVGVNRLRDEYEMGKLDQLKFENERKFFRIFVGLGVTSLSIIGSFFGIDAAPFYGLFINCVVHLIL